MTPTIKRTFSLVHSVSPSVAGWMAHQLFSTPLSPTIRTQSEQRLAARGETKLKEANTVTLSVGRRDIAVHTFSPQNNQCRGTIIMVHGWMSAARFMLAPVDLLRNNGFRIVLFDLPAHGDSSGRQTQLRECADVFDSVIESIDGPVAGIVAHSFGGAVTAYTLARGAASKLAEDARIILLASPNELSQVTRNFSEAIGLGRQGRAAFERRLLAPLGGDMRLMDGNQLLKGVNRPIHIIHCRDDEEVQFSAAERFAKMQAVITLHPLNGVGHRRILYHPETMQILAQIFS